MKKNKGYAILFTIVIVSAISVITAGITNATYKQLILSSLAKDSQTAFYQADTAGDCALYAEMILGAIPSNITTTGGAWSCGNTSLNVVPKTPSSSGYDISPINPDSSSPCFRISVTKTITSTAVSAKGYNICNTNNIRTVEREIKINLEE